MAKTANRRSRTPRAPRKKSGAKLSIDESKSAPVDADYWAENLRERCYEKAVSLHTGKETNLVALLDAAGEIYHFIKGTRLLSLSLGFDVKPEPAPHEWQSNDGSKQSNDAPPPHHDTNHKSKFEEISM